jgi:hypothetical protein
VGGAAGTGGTWSANPTYDSAASLVTTVDRPHIVQVTPYLEPSGMTGMKNKVNQRRTLVIGCAEGVWQ